MRSYKLTIELVPRTSYYSNVREKVSKSEWDIIRTKCYKEAGYKCEICGGKGNKHPVECHEVWDYNDVAHKQTLVKFISLCPYCHKVKHYGLAELRGEADIALRHLMFVNKIEVEEAIEYVRECFSLWDKRSYASWDVDISFVSKFLEA